MKAPLPCGRERIWPAGESCARRGTPVRSRQITRSPGYASARRFLTARLRPGALGRSLALGFVVMAVCGVLFAELLEGVLEGEGIAAVDQPVNAAVAARRTDALTTVFTVLTTMGDVISLLAVAVVVAGFLAWRSARSSRPLWITAVALGGSQVLVLSIKYLVGRPRPAPALAVIGEDGYAFPSGHSTASLVTFGILAWLVATVATRRLLRITVWAVAAVLACGVGLSRLYLGVHYLSDVLAAWALGAGWLAVVIVSATSATSLRRRARAAEMSDPAVESAIEFSHGSGGCALGMKHERPCGS